MKNIFFLYAKKVILFLQIKILIYGRINVKYDYPKGVGLMNTYKAYILRIYPTYS